MGLELLGDPRVDAEGVDPEGADPPPAQQPLGGLGPEPGEVQDPVGVGAPVGLRIVDLGPQPESMSTALL